MLAALALIAVLWFVVVAPSEKRYHARKLELMQERIARRRQGSGDARSDGHNDTSGDDGSE